MYFPSQNPVSTVHEEQGVWAPIDHQRVISKLNMELGILFHHKKEISLEPLPETMLDDAKASPVPDISLLDNNTDQTPIIIEVCKSKGQKEDIQKVIELIDRDVYGIREGFIYNYKTKAWFRYRFEDGGLVVESSFSIILNLDLDVLLA